MTSARRTAMAAGVWFLITEVSAIAGLALYQPALSDPGYVGGAVADGRVLLGALCELVLIAAIIGTAVTLYPVIRRQNEGLALGHVAGRILEAAIITVGIVSVLSLVTLRQGGAAAGADEGALVAVGQLLVAIHDWTFLLGPSVVLGVNSLLLAYLVYRSDLAPRPIAVLGLVGGPLVTVSAIAVLFGLYGPAAHAISALPVFAWEVSLAVYLIAKGFKSIPVADRTVGSGSLRPEPLVV
ncbi:DUF4386 domain-containing protein [Rhodococcus sp. MTM3W5.2]|uniref:DUF4386 domain-containing protein n=1 Tax=Rhodococcus sp. MTM3W5.2 TaxID=1805827 RepID=UPI00097C059B|nr:DUF4386 domain-containing protein [Rhodococcus sp. MTM3W5.2]